MQRGLRKLAWRVGRRIYCWGRGDLANDSVVNGERWLRSRFIAMAAGPIVLLDVGANRGRWTTEAIHEARSRGVPMRIHAFEPSTPTRTILHDTLAGLGEVTVVDIALSSRNGEAQFFSNGVASGTNSLSSESGPEAETVRVQTLDSYAREHGIERIGMVKVDTEGFDLEVLKGAMGMLSRGLIEVVQFEYNWRWLLNRASLRDVFDLVDVLPYRFGKLVRERIEFHDAWHFELDRYFENNYVLVRIGSAVEGWGIQSRFDSHNVGV